MKASSTWLLVNFFFRIVSASFVADKSRISSFDREMCVWVAKISLKIAWAKEKNAYQS